MAAQVLLEGQAQALTQRAIKLALAGDVVALRLCLDRLLPLARERHVTLDLPAVDSAHDVAAALARVIQATAAGKVTPGEAATLAGILQGYSRIIETAELEARVRDMEVSLGLEKKT